MNERFYLLKIKLEDIEPEIWRQFVVPGSITLDRLHDVIQIVMGWTDSHLFQFRIGKNFYTEYPESKEDGLDCGKYRLDGLINKKGQTFAYIYDFGDGWAHEILLEESNYSDPKQRSELVCLAGERACPPEDVGGVPGYHGFLEALKDPEHEEYENFMEWSGGEFESEKFNINEVNWELMTYMRWSRDRQQPWGRD